MLTIWNAIGPLRPWTRASFLRLQNASFPSRAGITGLCFPSTTRIDVTLFHGVLAERHSTSAVVQVRRF